MLRRAVPAALAALVFAVAGCGGDGGGSEAPEDPVAQVPSGLQEKVREARDPQPGDFPAAKGKTLQALADEIGGGSQMGLASSIFVAGRENRVAFGVIDQNAGFLYGKTALYIARTPGAPAKGPYMAPADVLVTDAPYRSQQAATEADPFAAVYAAQVPLGKPGSYSVMAVTLVGGKPVAAPSQIKVITSAQDKIPEVRGRERRSDRHAPADQRHARRLLQGGRQEARRAAVRDAAAVPVARLRAGRRRGAAAARPVRRPGAVHPPGGLRGQRPEQGPARAAAAVQPADGALAVRRRRGREDHRATRGLVRPRRVRTGAEDRAVTRGTRLVAALTAGAAVVAALAPQAAHAHGIVQRTSLPIPEWLFGWAAAIVLVVSFVGLALLWPSPRLQDPPWLPLPGGRALGSRVVEFVCGAIGVALLAIVIYAGYEGGGSALDNLAPTFILIDVWVGLVFASVLFGDVFRAFSPWRAIRLPGIRRYPERWGRWPAALALLGFTWVEVVSGWGEVPGDLTTAVVVYTVYTLAMQAVFGTEAWTRGGEAFAVYFNLFSRLSVWETRDRLVGLRPPLGGLPRLDVVPGTVAFVAVMIGTVAFDGIFGLDTAPKVVATLGLLLGVAVVGGFYRLGIEARARSGARSTP